MEYMVVDIEILKFFKEFRVARKKDLVLFRGISKGMVRRRLLALERNKDIVMTPNREYYLTGDNYSNEQRQNMINALDMAHFLVEKKIIDKSIRSANEPFQIASIIKDRILLFAAVFPGNEKIQSKLIDLENRGDVVLVLENEEQLKKMNLTKPVVKVFYLESIRE